MRPLTYLLVLVLGAGAAGLTACGSGDDGKGLIPVTDAGPLQSDFDLIAAAATDGDCNGVVTAVARAQADLTALPGDTSPRLLERLQQGLDTLRRQAADECVEAQRPATTATSTTPTTTTDTTTETVPAETVTTDTAVTEPPPETTETVPTTTTPVPLPDPGATGGVSTP